MTLDPYRTLGLQAGASMAEVKRAYRRLAKAFHPDSAGETALPRFLAIHEAYEAIRAGRSTTSPRQPGPAPASEQAPWRADPARARAARERARTSRRPAGGWSAPGGRTSSGASSGTGSTAAGTGRAGGSGPSGSTGSSGSPRSTGGRSGRRREGRKATMGSTSYDDAREPLDATWSGASWYGPTTGEYWIVNPREYADPRKHGPDYQQRARRPQSDPDAVPDQVGDATSEPASESTHPIDADDEDGRFAEGVNRGGGAGMRSRPRARGQAVGGVEAAGRRGWSEAPYGAAATAGAPGAARPGWAAGEHAGEAGPRQASRPPISATTRELLGTSADDPIRRLGVALLAWPPIGLSAAAAIGQLTGCSAYSADCAGSDALLPWLAQAGILGLLLLLPPIARLLAGGTVAVVLALVPATAFLVVLGGTSEPQAGFALAFLLAIAWLIGVGWSLAMGRRRGQRSDPDAMSVS